MAELRDWMCLEVKGVGSDLIYYTAAIFGWLAELRDWMYPEVKGVGSDLIYYTAAIFGWLAELRDWMYPEVKGVGSEPGVSKDRAKFPCRSPWGHR